LYPYGGAGGLSNSLLPELPAYWSRSRDAVLGMTFRLEPYWNGALKKAIAKGVTQQWDLKFKERNRPAAEKLRDVLRNSNGGRGFRYLLIQHLRDFYTRDNGAFIEIDREDNSKPGSRIVGIYHLDSMRCWRTGDPDMPVIYQDLHGMYHYLAWWQVWDVADSVNPENNYFGVGDCAAAGAYERIRRMAAIRLYEYQKMTGDGPQELNFVSGITPRQLEDLLATNASSQAARGLTVYKGAAVIPMMTKDAISNVRIPLAEMPANYDANHEFEQAAIEYSLELGLSKIDIRPLQGRMSGTATQSDVMDGQSEASGIGLWSALFEDFINNMVAPNSVSWFWAFNNSRARKAKADSDKVYADIATEWVDKGVMEPTTAINYLVDQDVLDPSYLVDTDVSGSNVLAEDDKPDVVDSDTPGVAQTPTAQAAQVPTVNQFAQQVKDAVTAKMGGQ